MQFWVQSHPNLRNQKKMLRYYRGERDACRLLHVHPSRLAKRRTFPKYCENTAFLQETLGDVDRRGRVVLGAILGAIGCSHSVARIRSYAFLYFRRFSARFSSLIFFDFSPKSRPPRKHPFAPNRVRDQNEAMTAPKIGGRWRASKRAGRLRAVA